VRYIFSKFTSESPVPNGGFLSCTKFRLPLKIFFCLSILLLINTAHAWVDPPSKIEQKDLGSGLIYSVYTHKLTGNFYFVRLSGNSNSWTVTPSVNPTGITKCCTVKNHAFATDEDSIFSVNASYFDPAKYPIGTVVINGEIVALDSHNRTSMGIKTNRCAIIGRVQPRAFVTPDDYFEPVWIWGYNHPSKANSIVAYNKYYGVPTLKIPSDGMAVRITDGVIEKVRKSGPVDIGNNSLVLIFRGKSSKHVDRFKPGGKVTYGLVMPKEWSDVSSIVTGGPRIIENGKVPNISSNPERFESGIFGKHSRTITGVTYNNEIFFAVFPSSVSYSDAASVLLEMNVMDAMSLDGGSSSSIWVKGIKSHNPGKQVPVAIVIKPSDFGSAPLNTIPYYEDKYWR
jgi:hypothetical protein